LSPCRARPISAPRFAPDEMWGSEALLDEVKENPKLSMIQPPAPMAFDGDGNLF
jgi:hypothetical protein